MIKSTTPVQKNAAHTKLITSENMMMQANQLPTGAKPLRKVRSKDRIPKHIQEKIAKRLASAGPSQADLCNVTNEDGQDTEVAATRAFEPVAKDQ